MSATATITKITSSHSRKRTPPDRRGGSTGSGLDSGPGPSPNESDIKSPYSSLYLSVITQYSGDWFSTHR
ncbi:hypothetical protein Acsp02_56590 [Actinoplanes sp. NBRC 103695]|nr:hypothetical protein Acsp02_56590 [Actinoplanes sp. NBRC 103695]